jgi:hypothetical protein
LTAPPVSCGSGNVLANASASLAGALQGYGKHDAARRLAQGKQPPRVPLRARGLPIKVVTAMIPATGGAATLWRCNGPGTAANLGARNMTAQQARGTAILADMIRVEAGLVLPWQAAGQGQLRARTRLRAPLHGRRRGLAGRG